MSRAERFGALLAASLRVIDEEAPDDGAALARTLGGLRVRFDVEGAAGRVVADRGRCEVVADGPADVVLRADVATLDALLDGSSDLLASLRADRLYLAGIPDDVLQAYDVWMGWLNAAVRCRTMPRVLARWRRDG